MPINPSIALGVKPVEMPNPLALYGQVAQIQNYQQQNALNQMKMEEAQRELAVQNALNQAYQGAYDPATQKLDTNRLLSSLATGGFGAQIPSVQKGIREAEAAGVKLATERQTLIKNKLEAVKPLYQQALASANPGAAMLEIHSAVHADPELGAWLKSMGATAERGKQDIMAAITQGPEAVKQKILTSISSVDKLLPTLVSTETGGGAQLGTRDPVTGAYTPSAVISKTPFPEKVEAQKVRIAQAGAPLTKVLAYTPASEEAQKEFMKSTRATYDQLKSVPAVLANMEAAKKLIPGAKKFMGVGGEPLLAAASFLNNRLGTDIATKGITDATELRSRLFQGILDNLRKLDAQPTQQQQEALKTALGGLGTDPNALANVLDSFADTLRNRVALYNQEVTDAETRGVRFPYKPQIKLPTSTAGGTAPPDVPQNIWDAMTPEEKALWQK